MHRDITSEPTVMRFRSSINKHVAVRDCALAGQTVTDGTDPNIQRHNYYLCVDTAEFGTGNITVIVHAYVPDTDFDGGIRDEYDKFTLTNVKPL